MSVSKLRGLAGGVFVSCLLSVLYQTRGRIRWEMAQIPEWLMTIVSWMLLISMLAYLVLRWMERRNLRQTGEVPESMRRPARSRF